MEFTLRGMVQAVIDTIRDPRAGARMVMSMTMNRRQRWEILLLVSVLTAILLLLTVTLVGNSDSVVAGPFPIEPFSLGIAQTMLLFLIVLAVHFVGRRVGGGGRLDDAILLIAWWQFIMICLQLLQTLALFLFPPVALLLGFAAVFLFFWLLTNFIAELHGFKSLTVVFVGIMVSLVLFAIVLSITLGLLGITLIGAA